MCVDRPKHLKYYLNILNLPHVNNIFSIKKQPMRQTLISLLAFIIFKLCQRTINYNFPVTECTTGLKAGPESGLRFWDIEFYISFVYWELRDSVRVVWFINGEVVTISLNRLP